MNQTQRVINGATILEQKARELVKKHRPEAIEHEIPRLLLMMMDMAAFIAEYIQDECEQQAQDNPPS